MNTPLNNALKPCPFCGSAVEESRDCAGFYNYHCTNRKCKCSLYGDYEHHMTGRKAWNTRANTPESSAAQGAMTVQCPSPCGWKELTSIFMKLSAHAVTSIDSEAVGDKSWDSLTRAIGIGRDVLLACAKAERESKLAQPSDATAQQEVKD